MKKAFNIAKTVLTVLLISVSLFMMVFTIVSVTTFNKANKSLFGYNTFVVLSDSMKSVDGDESLGYFKSGDLIFVKEIDPKELMPGDIISYTSTNSENYGETVTHMIRRTAIDAEGEKGFVTYGTSSGADDVNIVTYPFIIGKYEGKLSGVGGFFEFLKTTPGYIVCILIPFLLLIGMQGLNSIRLFKRYKAEELETLERKRNEEREELRAERAMLEEERRRQEAMMKRLMEMQESMSESIADKSSEENSPEN